MKNLLLGLVSVLSLGALSAMADDTQTLPTNITEYSVPDFSGVDCEKLYKNASNFLWALCEQDHLAAANRSATGFADQLEKTIRLLVQAQQEGLTVRQQNLAALFEGLVHCDKAKMFWDGRKMLPSPNDTGNTIPDDYSTTGFCSERNKAAGSFGDVRFNDLLVNKIYKDSTGAIKTNTAFAEDLVNRMATCQRDVVAEFNRCGQLTPQPLVTVVDNARQAAQTEMVSYFGCTADEYKKEIDAKKAGDPPGRCETLSGTAPASAMFARKTNRLKLVTDSSGVKLNLLTQKAKGLDNELKQYQSVFVQARTDVSTAFAAFQAASLLTDNIFKEYELWRQGLLGGDTITLLQQRTTQLTSYQATMTQLAKDLDTNVQRLAGMLIPVEVKREQLVELCRLDYCGLWNKNMASVATAACKKTSFATNAACIGSVTIDGTLKKVDDICSGLPATYRVKNLLPAATRTCMEPIITRNKSASPTVRSMFSPEL